MKDEKRHKAVFKKYKKIYGTILKNEIELKISPITKSVKK